MKIKTARVITPEESLFRSHYKSSLVMVYLSVLAMFSMLIYIAALLPNTTLFAFFSNHESPLQFLVGFFRFYLFTIDIMWKPFLVSFGLLLIGICWNAISTYRYLKGSGKRFVPLILMFPSWFIFISVPFLSYLIMFFVQLLLYQCCLYAKSDKVKESSVIPVKIT